MSFCSWKLYLLPLLYFVPSTLGGQIPIPPFFTPCDFPVPTHTDPLYRSPCHSYPSFPFICDLHQQLAHSSFQVVNASYQRYRQYFVMNGQPTFGIIIVRQLEPPPRVSTVYDDSSFSCMFDSDCQRIDAEVVTGFVNNVKTFLRVYAWKVHERWFAESGQCSAPNVLALLVIDGMVNDARKIPYVRIHSGESRMKNSLSNIELETANAMSQGWPLQKVIEDLVDDVGYALKEFHELGGEPRDHSVPRWARHVFLGCAALVLFALVIEWYIVRRKLAIKKSGSGIKVAAGKSKTHLMF